MGRAKKYLGAVGEKIASGFLRKYGYKILDMNFRTPFGELDIVARKKDFIVFIEVKTRSTSSLGPPYLSVTRMKQRSIIKNALYYLKRYRFNDANWRIDIVSVKLNGDYEIEKIELIENAVEDWR